MEKSFTVTTYRQNIDQVKGDREWSALEQDLLDACRTGREAVLPGKGDVPKDTSDPERRVRGDLIRYLLLGGCGGAGGARPNPKGVSLRGAWVAGFDFRGCETSLNLALHKCLFPEEPVFQDAHLGGLYLTGSRCAAGLNLHRLVTENDVHLKAGFHCTGLVNLGNARIGGTLDCKGGRFDGAGGVALDGDVMTVGVDVFLNDGFKATGTVNLCGARIGGQLNCSGGRFDGKSGRALDGDAMYVEADIFLSPGSQGEPCDLSGNINLTRARVEGNVIVLGAKIEGTLEFESARVDEGLYWREVEGEVLALNLTEAKLGVLRDDRASWRAVKTYRMSGLRYDGINSRMTVQERLAWLSKKEEVELVGPQGNLEKDFDPQPYSQLAKVLEAQGHRAGAARVLYEREDRVRGIAPRRAKAQADGSFRQEWNYYQRVLGRGWDWIFKRMFGYGHMPGWALIWAVGIWGMGWALFAVAYATGQMAPNSDVILTSADWIAGVRGYDGGTSAIMPLRAWESRAAYQDYETFSSFLYALDLLVPLDALGQENAWAPSKDRGFWGALGYWVRMPVQVMGWIITGVGAAVLTGLVGRKD